MEISFSPNESQEINEIYECQSRIAIQFIIQNKTFLIRVEEDCDVRPKIKAPHYMLP